MSEIVVKSTLVYSDPKNNVYKPADTINFYLPPSLSLINTKNTYLVFNMKLTGKQFKGAVSQKAGIYSLFRSIQISSGDGSTVLKTLDNYAESGKEYTKILAQIILQNRLMDFEPVRLANSVKKQELNL